MCYSVWIITRLIVNKVKENIVEIFFQVQMVKLWNTNYLDCENKPITTTSVLEKHFLAWEPAISLIADVIRN